MNRDHVVHPRWVWSGLVVGLVGACVVGVAMTWWPRVWILAGVALVLAGAVAALRGGILYDTHGAGPVASELQEVRDGEVHQGTVPGAMVDADPEGRERSVVADRTRRHALEATQAAPRPRMDRLAGVLLLVTGALVLGTQGLYAHTHLGQVDAARDLGLAAVASLAGLRILLGARPGAVPTAVAGLVGVAFVLLSALTDHDRTVVVVLEAVAGSATLAAALLSVDHRPTYARTR